MVSVESHLDILGLGRIVASGRDAGSAFAISDTVAVTAAHVLRGSQDRKLEFLCDVDGTRIKLDRPNLDESLDAATLPLRTPTATGLAIGRAIEGAGWEAAARPRSSDPMLTGIVTDAHRRLRNAQGRDVSLLQLTVDQELGDYQGYSGSAVTLRSPANALIGMLVEQLRWRTPTSEPRPASNVLFALPVQTIVQRFALECSVRQLAPEDLLPATLQATINRVEQTLASGVALTERRLISGSDETVLRALRSGLIALRPYGGTADRLSKVGRHPPRARRAVG